MISSRTLLADLDLTGTRAIVTGGYSGLGLETTRALAAAGATVIVPARRPDAARDALAGTTAEVEQLDLADLQSVGQFAERMLATGHPIHALVNNAGIMATGETRTPDGWEAQFATNHLGHFALTTQLWPLLAAEHARVVTVGSGVSRIHWDDVHFTSGYDKWQAYLQSKTANRLFALELDARGAADGIRSFSVTPGYILTDLQRHLSRGEMVEAGWVDEAGEAIDPAFRTPGEGAVPGLFAATHPSLAGEGGLHIEWGSDGPIIAPIAESVDAADAPRLWRLSADLIG